MKSGIHRNHSKSKAWDPPNPLKSFQIHGLGPSKYIEIITNQRPGTLQIHWNRSKSKAWDPPNSLKSFRIQGLGPSKSIEIIPNPRPVAFQIHRNPAKSKAWDPPNPVKSIQIQGLGPSKSSKSCQIQGLGPSKSIEILPNPRPGTLQIHWNPCKSKAQDPSRRQCTMPSFQKNKNKIQQTKIFKKCKFSETG